MTENIDAEQIEIIQDFIQECLELTDNLEPSIMDLGKELADGEFTLSNDNKETINAIFRLFHSMKGGAGFLDLDNIGATAHAAENLLDEIRKEKIQLQAEHIDLFCSACDFNRAALANVAEKLNDHDMAEEAEKLSADLKSAIKKGSGPLNKTAAQKAVHKKAKPKPKPRKKKGRKKEKKIAKIELDITPEMLHQFTAETEKQLAGIKEGLAKWQEEPADQDIVAEIFRLLHDLNKKCGFANCTDMEELSQEMLAVLSAARSGIDPGESKAADILLDLVEVIRKAVNDVVNGGKGAILDLGSHLDILKALLPTDYTDAPDKYSLEDTPKVGEILIKKKSVSEDALEEALAIQERPLGEVLVKMGEISEEDVSEALQEQEQIKQKTGKAGPPSSKSQKVLDRQDIRVDLNKLDDLIDLIGEMVIAENMLIHSPDLDGLELDNFQKSAQQMSKLVRELQEVAVTIRMIPVAGLFRRMTRLVHDLSRKSGKKVDFQLAGIETELDKTVIETISDPLVHLIRNSMDHGLESPEERVANGKPETGILKLSACHEEGEVWITIADDGRGLDREKILAKASANGIVAGDGAELSDQEVANMIFLPGFSTAEKVTDVSGRGVGMDVVRQNLNKINGKIDVDSRAGDGTRTNLRIPLTMAIIEGMLIRVGSTQYIIPILPIRESLRPDPKMITISPDGNELVMIREHLYPVLRLHEMHKIEPDSRDLHEGILLLLEDQENTFCLFVDEIMGQQQTVMKGLSEYIGKQREVKAVSGCTILANGEVCLILDVGGLSADEAHRRDGSSQRCVACC